MMQPTAAVSEKRTNVRSFNWRLQAIRTGLRALESGSPELAARASERLLFRTHRARPAAWEVDLLARGRRLRIPSRYGPLAAWTFGEGPLVVLVHGWNGRGSQLGGLVNPLMNAGLQVALFDAPGHGASGGDEASLIHFADAVDAVVEWLRPPFGFVHAIVAHSLGGAATTYAANRWMRTPETKIERALRGGRLPANRFVFVAPPIDPRDFVRTFTRGMGLGADTRALLDHRLETRFSMPMGALYAPDLARGMHTPLLVLHDEEDREVPIECGQKLAAAWDGATLESTRGLGHNRILHDDAVLSRIVSFVADA